MTIDGLGGFSNIDSIQDDLDSTDDSRSKAVMALMLAHQINSALNETISSTSVLDGDFDINDENYELQQPQDTKETLDQDLVNWMKEYLKIHELRNLDDLIPYVKEMLDQYIRDNDLDPETYQASNSWAGMILVAFAQLQSSGEWYQKNLLESGMEPKYCTNDIIEKTPLPSFPELGLARFNYKKLRDLSIDDLVSSQEITEKESEMLRMYLSIQELESTGFEENSEKHHHFQKLFFALSPKINTLKDEFESKFSKEEREKIPELLQKTALGIFKAIAPGLGIDLPKLGVGPGSSIATTKIIPSNATKKIPKTGIGFVNGIDNQYSDSENSAIEIFKIAEGKVPINLCYNPTFGAFNDVINCFFGIKGVIESPCVKLLLRQWAEFFIENGPNADYLQICHSGGAIVVREALKQAPQGIRDRIQVVAVAPATFIEKGLCKRRIHEICINDPIGAGLNFLKILTAESDDYGSPIALLPSLPGAKGFDHNFLSPTYKGPLIGDISDFLEQCEQDHQYHKKTAYPFPDLDWQKKAGEDWPNKWEAIDYFDWKFAVEKHININKIPNEVLMEIKTVWNEYAKAVVCFDKQIKLNAGNSELSQNEKAMYYKEAIQHLTKSVDLLTLDEVKGYFTKDVWEKAFEYFHKLRAQCSYYAGEYSIAATDFNKVFNASKPFDCWLNGVFHFRAGSIADARLYFKSAADLGHEFSKNIFELLC